MSSLKARKAASKTRKTAKRRTVRPAPPRQAAVQPTPAATSDVIWVTRQGKRLPIGTMDDDHVANCIAMLVRNRTPEQRKHILRTLVTMTRRWRRQEHRAFSAFDVFPAPPPED